MDRLNETDGVGASDAAARAGNESTEAGVADAFALDPRSTLNRLRAVVYDWDIVSDRLAWGANAAETLAAFPPSALATGAGFAELVTADSPSSRYLAIQESSGRDGGDGAPYRAVYRLAPPGGGACTVEDLGRWTADASGRPAHAHGLMRIVADDETPSVGAAAGLPERRAFAHALEARLGEARPGDAAFSVAIVGSKISASSTAAMATKRPTRRSRRSDAASPATFARSTRRPFRRRQVRRAAVGRRRRAIGDRRRAPHAARLGGAGRHVGRTVARFACASARSWRRAMDAAPAACCSTPKKRSKWRPASRAASLSTRPARRSAKRSAARPRSPTRSSPRSISAASLSPTSRWSPPPTGASRSTRRCCGSGKRTAKSSARRRISRSPRKAGLVDQLDQRVLELALDRLVAEPGLRVSVNFSVATLRSPGWLDRLKAALGAHPGAASRLIVEIVETLALEPVDEIERLLAAMKALGLKIAMDDFGAGHTSFRNLRRLGIDIVKIDGAFVQNVACSLDDRVFVRSLADLARHLGLTTVAEWVEDEEARRLLRDWGVDLLQGRLLGRPEIYEPSAAAKTAPRALAAG